LADGVPQSPIFRKCYSPEWDNTRYSQILIFARVFLIRILLPSPIGLIDSFMPLAQHSHSELWLRNIGTPRVRFASSSLLHKGSPLPFFSGCSGSGRPPGSQRCMQRVWSIPLVRHWGGTPCTPLSAKIPLPLPFRNIVPPKSLLVLPPLSLSRPLRR